MEVAFPGPGRILLSQETSASEAGIEANSGKGHLGLLQLQEEWGAGFDGRACDCDRADYRRYDSCSTRSTKGRGQTADRDFVDRSRGIHSEARADTGWRRRWRWRPRCTQSVSGTFAEILDAANHAPSGCDPK